MADECSSWFPGTSLSWALLVFVFRKFGYCDMCLLCFPIPVGFSLMYLMFLSPPPFLAPQTGESKLAQGFPAAGFSRGMAWASALQLSHPLKQQSYHSERPPCFLSLKINNNIFGIWRFPAPERKDAVKFSLPPTSIQQPHPRSEWLLGKK